MIEKGLESEFWSLWGYLRSDPCDLQILPLVESKISARGSQCSVLTSAKPPRPSRNVTLAACSLVSALLLLTQDDVTLVTVTSRLYSRLATSEVEDHCAVRSQCCSETGETRLGIRGR